MHAPVASWRLAAVLLSSSPGGARRARERGSKGEAFVTRQRYEHPLAGAAGRPVPRVHSHRTQRSTQGNGRARGHRCGHGTAARRAPPRAAGTSSFGSQGRSPAPGMRKAGHRPVPAGDERDRANLQPPDGGAAAGAPASTLVLRCRRPLARASRTAVAGSDIGARTPTGRGRRIPRPCRTVTHRRRTPAPHPRAIRRCRIFSSGADGHQGHGAQEIAHFSPTLAGTPTACLPHLEGPSRSRHG